MEPSKIKLDSSPPSSPLSPGKKVINSTSKKQAAANIDSNSKSQTCRLRTNQNERIPAPAETIKVLYHCSLYSSLIPYSGNLQRTPIPTLRCLDRLFRWQISPK